MALSEYSTVYRSQTPFIPQIDLSLLAKVNTYKENKFEQNASKIQESINKIGNLDVLKEEDKQYLNEKVNNLLTGINSMSGVDISDTSVANKLMGYGASVYNDANIINAITSTKKVRNLQEEYRKLATDSKFKDSYSAINEMYDMQSVQSWIADGKKGSVYSGPTNAFQYQNVDKFSADIAKEIKANYEEDVSSNGLYIDKRTNEYVDAERIKEEISSRLLSDGNMTEQVRRNSWYFGKGKTGNDIFNHFKSVASEQETRLQKAYDDVDTLYKQATLPEDKTKYAAILKKREDDLKKAKAYSLDVNTKGVEHFTDNLSDYNQTMYLDNLTTGVANTYAYSKTTHSVDEDKVALKLIAEQRQAATDGWDMLKDPTSFTGVSFVPNEAYMKAMSMSKGKTSSSSTTAPKKGQPNYVEDVLSEGGNFIAPNTLSDVDIATKDDKWVINKITEVEGAKQTIMTTIMKDLLIANPQLKGAQGESAQVNLIKLLKGRNNPNVIEMEDLQNIDKFRKQKINGVEYEVINDEQAKYIKNLVDSYKNISEGKEPVLKLTPSQVNQISQLHEKNSEASFYGELLKEYKGNNTSNLTPEEERRFISYETTPPKKVVVGKPTYRDDKLGVYQQPKDLVLKNGTYYPADGKDATYEGLVRRKGNGTISEDRIKLTISATKGINKSELDDILSRGGIKGRKGLYGVSYHEGDIKDYEMLQSKVAKNKTEANPESMKVLNSINQYLHKTFPSNIKSQTEGNLNRLKNVVYQEAILRSNAVTVEGALPDSGNIDMTKAYVENIGSDSNDPFSINVRVVIPKGTETSGQKSVVMTKTMTPAELKEYFNIDLPPTKEIYKQALLDVKGSTSPKYIQPSSPAKDKPLSLVVKSAIVKTSEGHYTPQLFLPDSDKRISPTLLPGAEATSLHEAESLLQAFIDAAYAYGITDVASLNTYLKESKK
jgi:hypothetical protein